MAGKSAYQRQARNSRCARAVSEIWARSRSRYRPVMPNCAHKDRMRWLAGVERGALGEDLASAGRPLDDGWQPAGFGGQRRRGGIRFQDDSLWVPIDEECLKIGGRGQDSPQDPASDSSARCWRSKASCSAGSPARKCGKSLQPVFGRSKNSTPARARRRLRPPGHSPRRPRVRGGGLVPPPSPASHPNPDGRPAAMRTKRKRVMSGPDHHLYEPVWIGTDIHNATPGERSSLSAIRPEGLTATISAASAPNTSDLGQTPSSCRPPVSRRCCGN